MEGFPPEYMTCLLHPTKDGSRVFCSTINGMDAALSLKERKLLCIILFGFHISRFVNIISEMEVQTKAAETELIK